MSGSVVKRALEAYQTAESEQAKAKLEELLWSTVPPSERRKAGIKVVRRELWLLAVLPKGETSTRRIECRQRLLRAPQVLWDCIHAKEVSIQTAVRIWVEAERLRRTSGADPVQETNRLLAERNGIPQTSQESPIDTAKRKHVPNSIKNVSNKKRWMNLREAILSLVEGKAEKLQIPEVDQHELINWLEREILSIIHAFDTRVIRFGKGKVEITRREVLNACRDLHIEPPTPGSPVDIAAAKRNKRRLVQQYHPDSARSDNASALYQAAIEAFDTVEQYNNTIR
jgi:hypothetical protein